MGWLVRLDTAGWLNWNGTVQKSKRADMKQALLASTKRTFLGGIVILALVLGGPAWWHSRAPVSTADVSTFLDRTVGGGRMRFFETRVETLRQDDADLQLTVAATARLLKPLYSKIDAADYLQREFQLDPASTLDARRLLADKGLSQNPEFMSAGPFPSDPYHATILQVQSPAGARFNFRGILNARRDAAGWILSLSAGGLEGAGPQGEPRSSFGDTSLVAGDANDDARLRALATGLQAFAGRVAEARQNVASAHAAAIEGRQKAFLALIAPGCVFPRPGAGGRGPARDAALPGNCGTFTRERGIRPLRNEGSWHNARTFQGSWSTNESLKTRSSASPPARTRPSAMPDRSWKTPRPGRSRYAWIPMGDYRNGTGIISINSNPCTSIRSPR